MIVLDFPGVLFLAIGIVVSLFLSGFAWSFVILGSKDVWSLERVMVSIGLSITIVPLTLLLLNLLFGVGVTLLSASIVIAVLIALAGVAKSIGMRLRQRPSRHE